MRDYVGDFCIFELALEGRHGPSGIAEAAENDFGQLAIGVVPGMAFGAVDRRIR